MSNVLTTQEINNIARDHMHDPSSSLEHMVRAIERAVLAKAGEQEPIYMWRLEDDGWMECTKEFFDADISSGYEKRIVYAHPLPHQAIPESKKLTLFSSRHDDAVFEIPVIPEGWQLVPIEPTTEMNDAYWKEYQKPDCLIPVDMWGAMLSASPKI